MRLERGKIVEIVAVASLLAGTAWLGQMAHHNYLGHVDSLAETTLAPGDLPAADLAGQTAPVLLAGRERPLLLLVLSTDCPFCEANMPNWRALADQIARRGAEAPELMVLSVSESGETRDYLARHGIDLPVRLISPSVLSLLGIPGYPGTVAFHPSSPALLAWTGVLEDGDQEAVMSWSRTPWSGSSQVNATN